MSASDAPPLAGTDTARTATRMSLVLDSPAPGTAFVAVEGRGDSVEVSIWAYLYGPQAADLVELDGGRWASWFAALAPCTKK